MVGAGYVDQIGGVAGDRQDVRFGFGPTKRVDFRLRQGAFPPGAGVFGKYLGDVATERAGGLDGTMQPAGDREMSPEKTRLGCGGRCRVHD